MGERKGENLNHLSHPHIISKYSSCNFANSLLSILIAIFIQNIIEIVFSVVAIGLAFALALVGLFIWRLKEKAVFYSIFLGLISAIILILIGYIAPETSVITLPVALVFLVIDQIIFKKEPIA